jgi:uncharacterized membrane protein
VSELIVAGFDDIQTAFLARAGLARLQKDLPLSGHDVAVVSREEDGRLTVREAINLNGEEATLHSFWRSLVTQLFFHSQPKGKDLADIHSAKLASIGIDDSFVANIENVFPYGASAVLVLASVPARDQVLGVLRGFQGRISRTTLKGDDRKVWRCALLGTQSEAAMNG